MNDETYYIVANPKNQEEALAIANRFFERYPGALYLKIVPYLQSDEVLYSIINV